jgi:predicted MFS family arabinose efflux permease
MLNTTINLYKNAYAGLPRKMWLLSLVMLINRSGTMVLAFMTLYCHHIGYTMQQGGWVVAIYGIGSLAGAFAGGKISDRFGFYHTQFLSLLCGGILFMILGQMQSYTAICICTFFLSMVNEAFRPANATAIAYYSSSQNRTQSFSLVRLAINLGWGIGSGLGGLLASINYHLLFWVDGCTNILAAFLLLAILPKITLVQQKQLQESKQKKSGTTDISSAYMDKPFLVFLGLQVLFATCFFQLFTTVPLYFKESLQLNEFLIGTVMGMNGFLIALVEMVIVFKLEGRKPYLILMSYGTLIMAFSFLLLNIPFAHGFIIALVFMFFITISEMTAMPFMNSYYIARSTAGNRGQYAALYTMAWSLAQVIGSSSGTQIVQAAGFFNLWCLVAAISFVGAAGYRYLYKQNVKKHFSAT